MRSIILFLCLAVLASTARAHDHDPMEFHIHGDRIVAVGDIDSSTLDRFLLITNDHPNLRTLELLYVGGSVDDQANLEFSRVVRQLGFTTLVPSDGLVASGGTDLFLAGTQRLLEDNACVGVHSWAAEDFTADDLPRSHREHDAYLEYYREMGITEAFYWFTLQAAPAHAMHWMVSDEAAQYGLTTLSLSDLGSTVVCDRR